MSSYMHTPRLILTILGTASLVNCEERELKSFRHKQFVTSFMQCSQSLGPAVGIDLGTTDSCVSIMESKTSHVSIDAGTPADMTAYGAFTHVLNRRHCQRVRKG